MQCLQTNQSKLTARWNEALSKLGQSCHEASNNALFLNDFEHHCHTLYVCDPVRSVVDTRRGSLIVLLFRIFETAGSHFASHQERAEVGRSHLPRQPLLQHVRKDHIVAHQSTSTTMRRVGPVERCHGVNVSRDVADHERVGALVSTSRDAVRTGDGVVTAGRRDAAAPPRLPQPARRLSVGYLTQRLPGFHYWISVDFCLLISFLLELNGFLLLGFYRV